MWDYTKVKKISKAKEMRIVAFPDSWIFFFFVMQVADLNVDCRDIHFNSGCFQ